MRCYVVCLRPSTGRHVRAVAQETGERCLGSRIKDICGWSSFLNQPGCSYVVLANRAENDEQARLNEVRATRVFSISASSPQSKPRRSSRHTPINAPPSLLGTGKVMCQRPGPGMLLCCFILKIQQRKLPQFTTASWSQSSTLWFLLQIS